MINLNRIRKLEKLDNLKKILTDFLNLDPIVAMEVYNDMYAWGDEDYDADKEVVKELLAKINKRYKSLKTYLDKQKSKEPELKK